MRIRVDQDEARRLGLSSQSVARILETVMSGVPMTQIRDDIYLINVVARGIDDQRVSIDSLRTLQIPLPNGRTVPLASSPFRLRTGIPAGLAPRPRAEPDRTGRYRPGVLPDKVVTALETPIATLNARFRRLRHRRRRHRRGERQVSGLGDRRCSGHAVHHVHRPDVPAEGLPRLLIVFSVAPLGLIGVVGALLLSGRPLGFVAILGILALLGMITKNAVILLGQIDAEREQGKSVCRRP